MKVKKTQAKENHLIIDAKTKNMRNLNSKEFIKKLLINLTKKINMKAISKPLVIKYSAKQKAESGITGTIILAESNITIHTYPFKKFFYLDIFSCKGFKIKSTINYLKKQLQITKYKKRILSRREI